MNTMFNSFTSILSPALKEKLGIGPKKRMEPKTDEGSTKSPRPLSPHNTTSRQRLSPTLRQLTLFYNQSAGISPSKTSYISSTSSLGARFKVPGSPAG